MATKFDPILGKLRELDTIADQTAGSSTPLSGTDVFYYYDSDGSLLSVTYEDLVSALFAETGDYLRDDFDKINDNFSELYELIPIKSIPAAAFIARTDNGATYEIKESSTYKIDEPVFLFGYAADKHIQVVIPNDGSITTKYFKATVTALRETASDNFGVAWGIQALVLNSGEVIDQAFGTAVVVTHTLTDATKNYDTAQSALITMGGSGAMAANSIIVLQIFRDVSDAADTMEANAGFVKVQIEFNLDAA